MTRALLELTLRHEPDVFAARASARQAATAVGLDSPDQVRVATAVSELGRVIVSAGLTATVTIGVSEGTRPALVIEVTADSALDLDAAPTPGTGLDAGRRLMDSLVELPGTPPVIRMTKRLPRGGGRLSAARLGTIRQQLAESIVLSPLDELRSQNIELTSTLEELKARQQELLNLNTELEETNQGVMAMYSQLSTELEETNRGVVALYAELDERSRELHSASSAKSRFLASVSHELRSPLSSVLGLAQLLREPDSESLTESQTYQIGLIETSVREVVGMVNDLLDLAKAESGRLDPMPARVSIDELLADLRGMARPLVPAGVDLVVDTEGAVADLETDAALLSQLLRNLLTNALKFTEQGEVRLTVSASESASLVTFVVADTGIGIADEHQDLVFEEFFQVPGRVPGAAKGTGLGLPHARRIAEALGGTLQVASATAEGSTFTVVLPMRWLDESRAVRASAETASSLRQTGTVLVVDDETSFRRVLRQMLQGSASRVAEADDAGGALEIMRRLRPDVVLLDLRIPDGGGERVLAEAAVDEELASIAIVVVTSAELDDDAVRELPGSPSILGKSGLTRDSLLAAIGAACPEVAR